MTPRTRTRILVGIVMVLVVPTLAWGAYSFMQDAGEIAIDPVCGDFVCDLGEGSSCPEDCAVREEENEVTPLPGPSSQSADACASQRGDFAHISTKKENIQCETDTDCMVFSASCPFLTCGMGINVAAANEVQAATRAYSVCASTSGQPISCADCAMTTVSCVGGLCMAQ
jgi:hypothetical protein